MHLQVFRRVYRSSYLWTLDDYYRSIWSPRHCIVINNLPADSLLYGKFLAFDRKDVNVILFRVKRQVFHTIISKHNSGRSATFKKNMEMMTFALASSCLTRFQQFPLPQVNWLFFYFLFFLDNSMNGSLQLILDKFLQPMYHCWSYFYP